MRAAVVCLIDQERTSRGLPALREDSRLDRSAQGWTDTMVAQQIFTHGADFSARITDAGLTWESAGENIATGFATPRTVVSAWMASTDHCQNILDPVYREVGTGVQPAPIAGFSSAGATWTQDFALAAGEAAASHDSGPANGCPY